MEPIDIQITLDRIEDQTSAPSNDPRVGSQLEFRGLVRAEENGQTIVALEYEAYLPMARRTLETLARDLLARHRCLAVRVIHRLGVVPVGETAILIQVASRHRQEGFQFLKEYMDQLKTEVPIWKVRALPLLPAIPDAPALAISVLLP
ncbi:MAG: molybdenum cofactor biosynthesis protein MoaE [Verrucomicrobia bacterium]|nr:molybdenum cofactor biosynthesis protein MoaE [Verrucomicrobiota bacterium]